MPRNETARIDVKKFNELRGSQTYESLVESSKKRGDKNAAFSARTIQRAVKGKAIQVQIIDMLGTLLKTTRENLMLSDIALLPDEPQPDRAPLIKFGPVAQATIEIAKFVDKAQIYRRIDGASNLFDSQHEFMELCRSLRACRPALDKLTEALPHFAGSDVFPQRVILRARLACTNASQEIVAFEIPQHEIVALADDQCVPSAIPIYYQWFPSPRVELEFGASRYVDIAVAVFCEDRDVLDALFFLRSSEEIRDWLMAAASLDRGFPLQFNVWFADGVTRPVTVQLQILKVPECLTKNWIYSGAAFEAALREVHEWGDPFYYLNARMSLLRSLWHGDKRRPPSRGPERWEALRRILALVEKHRPAVGQTHGSLASAACNDIGAEAPAGTRPWSGLGRRVSRGRSAGHHHRATERGCGRELHPHFARVHIGRDGTTVAVNNALGAGDGHHVPAGIGHPQWTDGNVDTAYSTPPIQLGSRFHGRPWGRGARRLYHHNRPGASPPEF